MSIMLEQSYVLLLHLLLFFLLLTSTYIPYVVIIFSHYTFCVTFNMLLYKKKRLGLCPCINLATALFNKDVQIAYQMFDVALSYCHILENQHWSFNDFILVKIFLGLGPEDLAAFNSAENHVSCRAYVV